MTDSTTPKGWVSAQLDQIAEVRLGRQRSPKNHTGDQMRPYLRAANVTWEGIDTSDVKEMNFTDAEVETHRLHNGDVLLSEASGSPKEVGKPAVWREQLEGDVCLQNTLIRVRPEHGVGSDFLYYRFLYEALRGGFVKSSRGVGIHHLGSAKLATLRLAVPGTSTQNRLVERLDEALGLLARERSDLLSLQRRLTALSSHVVATAIRDCGDKQRLGDLLREPLRNGLSARAAEGVDGVRTFTLTAVTQKNFSRENSKITVATPSQAAGLWCEPGDVFIQRSNTPELVGSAAVYVGEKDFAIFPDLLIRVRPKDSLVPTFLEYALRTPVARQYFKGRSQGLAGSMPKISQGVIEEFTLPVPDPTVQRAIVSKLDELTTQIAQSASAVKRLEDLHQRLVLSVLTQAFAGELSPPEPDSPSGTDLLEQIRAAREKRNASGEARTRRTRSPKALKLEETNP